MHLAIIFCKIQSFSDTEPKTRPTVYFYSRGNAFKKTKNFRKCANIIPFSAVYIIEDEISPWHIRRIQQIYREVHFDCKDNRFAKMITLNNSEIAE